MEILRPEQQVMQAALAVRSVRAELLAGNVANADTPGYVGRDLKFEDALNRIVDSGSEDPAGIETNDLIQNMRYDRNNIDVEQEMAQVYSNALSYVATLKLYGDSMARVASATSNS
jgi:flagellar basal-body rod protein FlgB